MRFATAPTPDVVWRKRPSPTATAIRSCSALPRGGLPVAAEIAAALAGAARRRARAQDRRARPAGTGDGRAGRRRRRRPSRATKPVISAARSRRSARSRRRRNARWPNSKTRGGGSRRSAARRRSPVAPRSSSTTASPPAQLRAPRCRRSAAVARSADARRSGRARRGAGGLRREVDDLVCLRAPIRFGAVSMFYADFAQVDDDEAIAILAPLSPPRAAPPRPMCDNARVAAKRRRTGVERAAQTSEASRCAGP